MRPSLSSGVSPHNLPRQRQALPLRLYGLRGALVGRTARTERGRAPAPGAPRTDEGGAGPRRGALRPAGPPDLPARCAAIALPGSVPVAGFGGRVSPNSRPQSSRPDPTWSKHHDLVVAHADQSRKATTSPGDTPGGVLCLSPYHATATRAGVLTHPGISGLEHSSF